MSAITDPLTRHLYALALGAKQLRELDPIPGTDDLAELDETPEKWPVVAPPNPPRENTGD